MFPAKAINHSWIVFISFFISYKIHNLKKKDVFHLNYFDFAFKLIWFRTSSVCTKCNEIEFGKKCTILPILSEINKIIQNKIIFYRYAFDKELPTLGKCSGNPFPKWCLNSALNPFSSLIFFYGMPADHLGNRESDRSRCEWRGWRRAAMLFRIKQSFTARQLCHHAVFNWY